MEYDTYQSAYTYAFNYLKEKYGYIRYGMTNRFSDTLRFKNQKQRKELIDNSTDRDYVLHLNPITDESDHDIRRLMEQSVYGIEAKKELYLMLLERGIIKSE